MIKNRRVNPWRKDGWAFWRWNLQYHDYTTPYFRNCRYIFGRGVARSGGARYIVWVRAMGCIFFFLAWRWTWTVAVCLIVCIALGWRGWMEGIGSGVRGYLRW